GRRHRRRHRNGEQNRTARLRRSIQDVGSNVGRRVGRGGARGAGSDARAARGASAPRRGAESRVGGGGPSAKSGLPSTRFRLVMGSAEVTHQMPPEAATPSRRARGGAEARRAARGRPKIEQLPFISRMTPGVEVLSEEGLQIIEHNADTILAEVRIEFHGDEESLKLWKEAGADVRGARIHFPRGLPRSIIQKSAPREYVQHARNPARNVTVGGKGTVFAPVYGPPFIRNLDEGRRYATIEDFRNFVKLAY